MCVGGDVFTTKKKQSGWEPEGVGGYHLLPAVLVPGGVGLGVGEIELVAVLLIGGVVGEGAGTVLSGDTAVFSINPAERPRLSISKAPVALPVCNMVG